MSFLVLQSYRVAERERERERERKRKEKERGGRVGCFVLIVLLLSCVIRFLVSSSWRRCFICGLRLWHFLFIHTKACFLLVTIKFKGTLLNVLEKVSLRSRISLV